MTGIDVAIVGDGGRYADDLMAYLAERGERNVAFHLFSDLTDYEGFLRKGEPGGAAMDAAILTEEAAMRYCGARSLSPGLINLGDEAHIGVLCMCGKGEEAGSAYPGLKKIAAYAAVADVWLGIVGLASLDDLRIGPGGMGGSPIISFYSPQGGSGVTTVSSMVAASLSMLGKRAAYISLERSQARPAAFDAQGGMGMSDLLYFVRERDKSLVFKVSETLTPCRRSGALFPYRPASAAEMGDVTEGDAEFLLSVMRCASNVDVTVVDLDPRLDAVNLKVLAMADLNVIVAKEERSHSEKLARFCEACEAHFGAPAERALEPCRWRSLINMAGAERARAEPPEAIGRLAIPGGRIPEDRGFGGEGGVDWDSELGRSVRAAAEWLRGYLM
ncbi:MAG: hypothetical protein FWE70_02910 [Oscillospiraceae bacterium]|nr:hypothetical protein [Oscillospiraceae bacterium]